MLFLILNFRRLLLKYIMFTIFISVILLVFSSHFDLEDIGKADRLIIKNKTSKDIRLEFADRSLELISLYPMGLGIGNWQEYCNRANPHHLLRHEYPHNLIFEIFVELGVLGGVLLLVLLLKSLYHTFFRMLYTYGDRSFYQLLFYLQVFLFINSLFSGSLSDSRLLFVVIAISLISPCLSNKKTDE